MLVISGPSGAGKTSIVSALIAARSDLVKSVSVTTRPRRTGEVEGVDYRFVGDGEFDALIAADAFLEWATVHGNRYGTPRDQVDHAIATARTVVLEIDVQGAASVRRVQPDATLIFIEPPSWEVLQARLTGRGTDAPEVIERRLRHARTELAEAGSFDRRVINDELADAVAEVLRILDADAPGRGSATTQENP